MSDLPELDYKLAHRLWRLNRKTGELFWRKRTSDLVNNPDRLDQWNAKWAGKRAGGINDDGYRKIKWNGKKYHASHIVHLMIRGVWPKDQLDHRSGDRDNNALGNLRPSTNRQNTQNRKMRCDNKTGYPGVVTHSDKFRSSLGNYGFTPLRSTAKQAYWDRLYLKAKHHEYQRFDRGYEQEYKEFLALTNNGKSWNVDKQKPGRKKQPKFDETWQRRLLKASQYLSGLENRYGVPRATICEWLKHGW